MSFLCFMKLWAPWVQASKDVDFELHHHMHTRRKHLSTRHIVFTLGTTVNMLN